MIHYAKIENSPRLQRLREYLSDYQPHTTLDIIRNAEICAVNTAVAELRKNNYKIDCKCIQRGIYNYQMKGE